MYKKIIFIALAAITIVGCRKDPSDVAPVDQLDSGTYPKTLTDLSTFLVPGYSNFRVASLYGLYMLPAILSNDHTFSSTIPGQNIANDFLVNNINPASSVNAGIYASLYQGVADMNVFFERANYYQNNYGGQADVDKLRGQAYFLRAYYFFQLECMYGEQYIDMRQPEDPNVLGIPLPVQFATTVPQTSLPRSSAYKVWSQIISDLKLSAQYLHGVTYPVSSPIPGQGKVTEWSANGLLGKAYVFTKQYDSAKVYLLKVINNGVNSLMPFAQYKNSFNGDVNNEFNSESLFEVDVERQGNLPGVIFTSNNYLSLTTNEGEWFQPTILGQNGADGNDASCSNLGQSYCQFFVHDQNLKRFGFNLPIYHLDSNTNYVRGTPSTAITPALIMDTASQRLSLAARTDNSVDPRLFVCAMEPWIDSVQDQYDVDQSKKLNGVSLVPLTIPVAKAFIINAGVGPVVASHHWGWSFRKYATIDNSIKFYGGNDAGNLYLLRLADVYLLYAEACANTGDVGNALKYINLVHSRAYSNNPPTTYGSLNDATKADPSDVNLAHDPLKYERYAELFGEGGWWFDVCRWGMGATEAAYYVYGPSDYDPLDASHQPSNSIISSTNWSTTNSAAYHFPIPNVELLSNAALKTQKNGGQNNGYQ